MGKGSHHQVVFFTDLDTLKLCKYMFYFFNVMCEIGMQSMNFIIWASAKCNGIKI
jgi:hypothetical protein